ncbi:MAG: polyprenyl synthetase family protein [Acidimicrobiales bacterium]|nr:polyprenyl synthetase family protein [Acidimicrobiales bacterium]
MTAARHDSEPDNEQAETPEAILSVAAATEALLREILETEIARWSRSDLRLGEAVVLLGNMVLGRGKRLRAAFCYWAWDGTRRWIGAPERNEDDVMQACAAFELLQAFALIHDDIMDNASTRRGVPTIHTTQGARVQQLGWRGEPRRYGEGVAILLGDLAHAYADRCIGNTTGPARALWDELRIELNLGQYLDLRSSAAGENDRATAQAVATFKSALYTIVRPLQMGASLAPGWEALSPDAKRQALDRLEAFGRPLGDAFQLRDDLLGVVGDARETGKPVGNDLREGKSTELLAIALERAGAEDRRTLAAVGHPDLNEDHISAIVDVLHRTGAISEVERKISELVQQALATLSSLRIDPSTQVTMASLADYVGLRTH